MGHTVWSQRMVLDMMISEMQAYGKALRQEDRAILEQLLKIPLKYVAPMSYANSLQAWAFMLLAITIEQQKQINYLRELTDSVIKD